MINLCKAVVNLFEDLGQIIMEDELVMTEPSQS